MIRGVWLDPQSFAALRGRDGVKAMVERMHRAHVNILIPPVVHEGWTLYRGSTVAPQLPAVRDWREDPLQTLMDTAADAGMEVHASMSVFAAGYGRQFGAVLQAHPEWAERTRGGSFFSSKTGYSWLNPAMPEVIRHLEGQCDEIMARFPVAGIHLDYVRYCQRWEDDFGFSDFTRQAYLRERGVDPREIAPGGAEAREFNLWREANVTNFVRRLGARIRGRVRFSAAVFSDVRGARAAALQNWPLWAQHGLLDFLCPMSYTANTEEFSRLVGEAIGATAGTPVPAYSGIGFNLPPEVLERELELVRRFNPEGGQMIFSLLHLRDEHYAVLERNP